MEVENYHRLVGLRNMDVMERVVWQKRVNAIAANERHPEKWGNVTVTFCNCLITI